MLVLTTSAEPSTVMAAPVSPWPTPTSLLFPLNGTCHARAHNTTSSLFLLRHFSPLCLPRSLAPTMPVAPTMDVRCSVWRPPSPHPHGPTGLEPGRWPSHTPCASAPLPPWHTLNALLTATSCPHHHSALLSLCYQPSTPLPCWCVGYPPWSCTAVSQLAPESSRSHAPLAGLFALFLPTLRSSSSAPSMSHSLQPAHYILCV